MIRLLPRLQHWPVDELGPTRSEPLGSEPLRMATVTVTVPAMVMVTVPARVTDDCDELRTGFSLNLGPEPLRSEPLWCRNEYVLLSWLPRPQDVESHWSSFLLPEIEQLAALQHFNRRAQDAAGREYVPREPAGTAREYRS